MGCHGNFFLKILFPSVVLHVVCSIVANLLMIPKLWLSFLFWQVDLFFYREPEEAKEQQEEEAPAPDYADYSAATLGVDTWGTGGIPEGEWSMNAPQPAIAAVAPAGWTQDLG